MVFIMALTLSLASLNAGGKTKKEYSKETKLKYVKGCLRALLNQVPDLRVRVLCQALIIGFLIETREEQNEVKKERASTFLIIPKLNY